MEWNNRGIQGSGPSLWSWGLSRGRGWGQEEGAAGVPGEVTLFPHICVQRPLIATHMQTLTSAHANTFTQTHMCIHIYTHTHMCNALMHRHTHLQVHRLAHAQPFRAIFDIPLPQGGMSMRVLMSSVGCVSSALTSALLQDLSPTLTSTVPHPRRLRPIVPPRRNPEKGWQSIPHFSPLQDGAQWRNGREGGGARAVLTPSVWYLTTGPRWKSLGVVFADSRGVNAPTRPMKSSRRHSRGRGVGGEGRVLETSSSMALGGPCPGV